MAKSQFEPKLHGVGVYGAQSSAEAHDHVGGPLEIAAPEDYEHPIVVQFQVVQVPRGEHDAGT